ncbi:hypothetical protein BDV93DRAFT_518723 [Ceratobasidium sp. AG-I]|nr:hypothetical protein BDV93DRAFT_518723 [Ceratobasidium sp. AG-I]
MPANLIRAGSFAKVPFISGNQLDEGTVFVNGSTANSDEGGTCFWNTQRNHHTGALDVLSYRSRIRVTLQYWESDIWSGRSVQAFR